jgi:hypothetical protein
MRRVTAILVGILVLLLLAGLTFVFAAIDLGVCGWELLTERGTKEN